MYPFSTCPYMLLYFRISLPQSSHIPNQTHMPTSYLAPMVLNLFSKHKINLYIFNYFSTLRWQRYLKFYLMEDKDLFILHSQYQGCWWLGYLRSQGISSKGIKLVLPEYYGFSTRKVNTLRPRQNGRFPNRTLYLQNIPTCHWYHSYMLAVVYSNGKYTN